MTLSFVLLAVCTLPASSLSRLPLQPMGVLQLEAGKAQRSAKTHGDAIYRAGASTRRKTPQVDGRKERRMDGWYLTIVHVDLRAHAPEALTMSHARIFKYASVVYVVSPVLDSTVCIVFVRLPSSHRASHSDDCAEINRLGLA
ncbi:hypothetical protein K490DRAFT_60157 [Saccharata proteae CBS 121410]|uniref:Secreted protein n=1 Tax=Saccharata proteae CBS 121410 TaxID=1314787 RepID=A0A9P4HP26_9PEZI|nr:hypothetical protein K490DRAFT_60157 [Saccharata proteae CBS 121410]